MALAVCLSKRRSHPLVWLVCCVAVCFEIRAGLDAWRPKAGDNNPGTDSRNPDHVSVEGRIGFGGGGKAASFAFCNVTQSSLSTTPLKTRRRKVWWKFEATVEARIAVDDMGVLSGYVELFESRAETETTNA